MSSQLPFGSDEEVDVRWTIGVQRRLDQLRDPLVIDPARLAGADVVIQTGNAPLDQPRAPLACQATVVAV